MAAHDLLFSQAANADGPVEIVFGDDSTPLPPAPPVKGELLFSQPSNPTSGPVDIVFGDDEPGAVVDAVELLVSGSITGLRGTVLARVAARLGATGAITGLRGAVTVTVVPRLLAAGRITGLRGTIAVPYDINVERPLAATTRTGWQNTQRLRTSQQQRFEQAQPTYAALQTVWQNAARLGAAQQARWQQAQPLATIGRQALQQATPVASAPHLQRFEQAQSLRITLMQRLQQARPLATAPPHSVLKTPPACAHWCATALTKPAPCKPPCSTASATARPSRASSPPTTSKPASPAPASAAQSSHRSPSRATCPRCPRTLFLMTWPTAACPRTWSLCASGMGLGQSLHNRNSLSPC